MGIVNEVGRVESMWGTYPVYDHGLWEVPAAYGNDIRYFARPQQADALGLILAYAETLKA